ncbi:MAG: hypothetical protein ACRC1T_09580 [Clostridium chrysemydis]|uniref:hypothetical protein n=1 Tax=Clostridium chrysemydis TaxID=2665504 RepID=UPI003F33FA12
MPNYIYVDKTYEKHMQTKADLIEFFKGFKNRYMDANITINFKTSTYVIFMGESYRGVLTGYYIKTQTDCPYFKSYKEAIDYICKSENKN